MKQVNLRNQASVGQYNQALKSSLQTVAKQYNQNVAQANIALSQQATKTTQLLRYNVQQAYNANKVTYTPQSTQLPTNLMVPRKSNPVPQAQITLSAPRT